MKFTGYLYVIPAKKLTGDTIIARVTVPFHQHLSDCYHIEKKIKNNLRHVFALNGLTATLCTKAKSYIYKRTHHVSASPGVRGAARGCGARRRGGGAVRAMWRGGPAPTTSCRSLCRRSRSLRRRRRRGGGGGRGCPSWPRRSWRPSPGPGGIALGPTGTTLSVPFWNLNYGLEKYSFKSFLIDCGLIFPASRQFCKNRVFIKKSSDWDLCNTCSIISNVIRWVV